MSHERLSSTHSISQVYVQSGLLRFVTEHWGTVRQHLPQHVLQRRSRGGRLHRQRLPCQQSDVGSSSYRSLVARGSGTCKHHLHSNDTVGSVIFQFMQFMESSNQCRKWNQLPFTLQSIYNIYIYTILLILIYNFIYFFIIEIYIYIVNIYIVN